MVRQRKAQATSQANRRGQTDAERLLWAKLRDRRLDGVKFRRQHPIGPYIADFCSAERRLVVEVDGGQHAQRATSDGQRTRYLAEAGYRVLRFWNPEVLTQIQAVLERISEALTDPHPNPLPGQGEGAGGPVRPLSPAGERARVRGRRRYG